VYLTLGPLPLLSLHLFVLLFIAIIHFLYSSLGREFAQSTQKAGIFSCTGCLCDGEYWSIIAIGSGSPSVPCFGIRFNAVSKQLLTFGDIFGLG
jgi:hypothetical protein